MTNKKYLPQTLCVLFAAICILAVTQASAQEPVPATPEQQQQLMAWIPPSCCVTNNCCFEVSSSELQSLENDQWRVVATGQVLRRTEWSHNGKYIRCACDHVNGAWKVHRNANTRCVFPVMQSAGLK
jgi:hypothetical protein